MQKLFITFIMLACIKVSSQNQETHQLNIQESVIHWTGSYSFHFSEHQGTVRFKEGAIISTDGNITGGSFIIDMRSISNAEYLNGVGPVAHIRNEDFFDVEKFPEALLVITKVEYLQRDDTHRMYADLTIKGVTQSVKFYAKADANNHSIKTKLKIDRTRWGITYNNKLKNEAISDAIAFNVILQFQTTLE